MQSSSPKASKNGNGLLIPEDLPGLIHRGHAALTRSEPDSLKWVEVLFRKPTPGEFKMRVTRPNGRAEARPLRTIADLSRRLGNGVPSHDALAPVEVYGGIPFGARVSRARQARVWTR
jgi:sulfite reductase beta subunit-like hemoprotein